ncbi:HAD family hydrolase [Flavobacterium sp. 7A]|uniref:HAD family hydrolase n=1 Tax=Flavobacterium sp. 7A TaxID=2940571 RepID=UPI002227136C|nr:HAD family hydrolase [Flavobacterium sp. 7A]MCW2120792.1 HAD superfamily hydrolase (TIGR01509 family) [Flavobacterium sp. 7A]
MIQTIIFDMDGVIVDTEPVHRYAYFQHYKELGIEVSEEVYTSLTGQSTRNTYQKLKEKFNLTGDVEDMIQRKRALFNDAFDTKEDLQLLDGVEDLIKDCYQNGMQLILASSASKVTIDRVFGRFNLHQFFTHKVSGEDFPESKPNPAIFLHATTLSVAPKQNCIVIEDSTNGVKAAKSADIYCVGYNSIHSNDQDLDLADRVINHFNELNYKEVSQLQ